MAVRGRTAASLVHIKVNLNQSHLWLKYFNLVNNDKEVPVLISLCVKVSEKAAFLPLGKFCALVLPLCVANTCGVFCPLARPV